METSYMRDRVTLFGWRCVTSHGHYRHRCCTNPITNHYTGNPQEEFRRGQKMKRWTVRGRQMVTVVAVSSGWSGSPAFSLRVQNIQVGNNIIHINRHQVTFSNASPRRHTTRNDRPDPSSVSSVMSWMMKQNLDFNESSWISPQRLYKKKKKEAPLSKPKDRVSRKLILSHNYSQTFPC